MKNTATFMNDKGREFNVKVLFKGDVYGLDNCLTHDEDAPMVEFYDATYSAANDDHRFDFEGQFVSRYYAKSIAPQNGHGLDLMGYEPAWKIDAAAMKIIRDWIVDIILKGGE